MKVSLDPRVDKAIRDLPSKDNGRIIQAVTLLQDYGFTVTSVYLKKLKTGLWELRSGRWRLLFGVVDQEAIIVDIFRKKTQKTPMREIKTALTRMKEYQ